MTAPSPSPAADNASPGAQDPRLWLSALADGEPAALPHATALWRDDAAARESWHLYHLIGDVMRSDDLAARPARDAQFLADLRQRLAREPVPLAPAPVAAPSVTRRLGWRAPAAVAAGFVAVAATLVLLRPQGFGPDGAEQVAEGAVPTAGPGLRVVPNTHPSARGALVAEGRMIRDARLDAYLQAHQAARGNSPAALPGGGLRSVDLLVTPHMPAASAMPRVQGSASRPAVEPR